MKLLFEKLKVVGKCSRIHLFQMLWFISHRWTTRVIHCSQSAIGLFPSDGKVAIEKMLFRCAIWEISAQNETNNFQMYIYVCVYISLGYCSKFQLLFRLFEFKVKRLCAWVSWKKILKHAQKLFDIGELYVIFESIYERWIAAIIENVQKKITIYEGQLQAKTAIVLQKRSIFPGRSETIVHFNFKRIGLC